MLLCKIKDFEINFSCEKEILTFVESLIQQNKSCQIVTLNLLMYLQSKKDKEVYYAIKNADLVLPDSFGIKFFGSIICKKFLNRFAGIDLIYKLINLSKKKGYRIYLLGSKEDVVKKTFDVMKYNFGANVVGYHNGYFDKNEEDKIIAEINSVFPEILLVGLSIDKQEKWIYKNLSKIKSKIIVGVGGSFDVISGTLHRAPKIFIYLGLEWFFRLIQEPWRIVRILKLPVAMITIFFDILFSKSEYKKI
jgi:N-acetylglucosaminyldiphosphoundecaprenol N-acetyl-beta-D-mannosaminyltransferase